MASDIRPAGIFDTSYDQDIMLNRTRADRYWKRLSILALLLLPILSTSGPLGIDIIPEQLVGTITRIAIFVIAVQGLNLLIGYTGQISLGHAAFIAVGAYSSAILVREFGVNIWLALPLAALITGLVGLLFGLPSLRVKGFYLAMATLAAQFIIPWVLRFPMEAYTGGTRPLNVPAPLIGPFGTHATNEQNGDGSEAVAITIETGDSIIVDMIRVDLSNVEGAPPELLLLDDSGREIPSGDINMNVILNDAEEVIGLEYMATRFGAYTVMATPAAENGSTYTLTTGQRHAISFASDFAIYYLIMPTALLMMLIARNILRTRVGRAFISIRDNDLAAELLGINVFTYKLRAFFLSAIYAGVAGALIAFDSNSLSLDRFRLDLSVEMLAMLIIGGMGFPLGAMFGVGFVRLMTDIVIPALAPILREHLPNVLPFIETINIDAAANPILFGLILMIFLILEPRGLAHRWEIFKIAWKIRPYSY